VLLLRLLRDLPHLHEAPETGDVDRMGELVIGVALTASSMSLGGWQDSLEVLRAERADFLYPHGSKQAWRSRVVLRGEDDVWDEGGVAGQSLSLSLRGWLRDSPVQRQSNL
jgi:hypothetical protein